MIGTRRGPIYSLTTEAVRKTGRMMRSFERKMLKKISIFIEDCVTSLRHPTKIYIKLNDTMRDLSHERYMGSRHRMVWGLGMKHNGRDIPELCNISRERRLKFASHLTHQTIPVETILPVCLHPISSAPCFLRLVQTNL